MVALFVLKLVAGIVLMWLLMPRRDVTDGFFRIQMLVVLGLTVLLVLTLEPATLTGGAGSASPAESGDAEQVLRWLRGMNVAAAVIAYAGHIFWKLGRRVPGNACIYSLGALTLAALGLHAVVMVKQVPAWLQLLSEASSAAVLGATLTGMLLGHWYLTTPAMSIQPLTWFTRALFFAGLARLLATVIVLVHFRWPSTDTTLTLWLIVRWIGSMAVPLATAFVVARILKYRNTQSATGVLFAALILVFMGEMSATLIERTLSLPY
ncbi:MAG: hypothetical protein ACK58L_08695 [Planctomycetota bacterium]